MRHVIVLFSVLAICAVLLLGGGCSSKQKEVVITKTDITTTHEHKIGPNGGLVAGVGLDDKLHVELVMNTQNLIFYILGEDEKTPVEIPAVLMTAMSRNTDDFEQTPVIPATIAFNDPNKPFVSSKTDIAFVGNLPKFNPTNVSLKLNVGQQRYTVQWDLMPTAKPTGEEADICLKPGGIYTLEDIKANGNIVPSSKYKGFIANHIHPSKGEWICPITGSRGDERCWWIINNEKYYFCCPPCCVNAIQMAKNNTGQLKPAKEYIKRD